MKRKINVKPATELDLEFEDGTVMEMVFNTEALMYITDLPGGMADITSGKNIPEMCAKMIYGGINAKGNIFTIEEARKIVSNLDISTITEIIQGFNGSVPVQNDEEALMMQKKLLEELLKVMK